jgi:hypothetical protein
VAKKEREEVLSVQKNQKGLRNLGSQNALDGVKLIIIKLIKYVIII